MFDDQDTDPQGSDGDQEELPQRANGKPPLNPTRRASAPGALPLPSQKGGKKTTPPRTTAAAAAGVSKKSSASPFDAGRLSIIGGNENPLLPSPQSSISRSNFHDTDAAPFESFSPDFGDGGGGYDEGHSDDDPIEAYNYEPKSLSPNQGRGGKKSSSPPKSVLESKKTQLSGSKISSKQVTPKKKSPVRSSVIPESDDEEEAEFGSPLVAGGKNNRRISFASTIMDTPGSDEFPVGRHIDDDSYSEQEDNEGILPSCHSLLSSYSLLQGTPRWTSTQAAIALRKDMWTLLI